MEGEVVAIFWRESAMGLSLQINQAILRPPQAIKSSG
jgi:hypothetical protein